MLGDNGYVDHFMDVMTLLTSDHPEQLGLPGSRLRPDAKDDRVPIMLIQTSRQNTHSRENPVHGFLILLPSGWAMPFWQSFVFTGSLIGGIDERRVQHSESGVSSFPEAFPATESYRDWWTRVETHDVRRWQRRPPAKRLNLTGLGPQRGWQPDWKLVAQHAQEASIISREELAMNGEAEVEPWLLPLSLAGPILASKGTAQAERELERICGDHRQRLDLQAVGLPCRISLSDCLLQVVIEYTGRGKPNGNAAVFSEQSGIPRHLGEDDGEKVVALSQQHAIRPDAKPLGFVLVGGTSLARGHGYATGAVSLLSLLQCRFDQNILDHHETRVLVRNRGHQVAWPAVVRLGC
jgi:ribonuclease P/MRP protein subunit POP1